MGLPFTPRHPHPPDDEVKNNLMWWDTRRPQEIVDAGQTSLRIPAEPLVSPNRAEADALIARAENPIIRANMAASVRRALRAQTKARCVPRARETRRGGRMAIGERRLCQDPYSHFAICTLPFAPTRYFPPAQGWRPSPWRRHTLVWSPFGAYRFGQE